MSEFTPFNARAISSFKQDRLYRIYLETDEVFFIRTPEKDKGEELIAHMMGGVIGVLIWRQVKKRRKPKEEAELRERDQTPPVDLLSRHKHSFRASVRDFMEPRITPPHLLGKPGHLGRWVFTLQEQGKMNFEFEDLRNMKLAFDQLPMILGPALHTEVEWDQQKQKFVKRKEY